MEIPETTCPPGYISSTKLSCRRQEQRRSGAGEAVAVSSRHVVQLDQGDAGRESWSGKACSDSSDQPWELG